MPTWGIFGAQNRPKMGQVGLKMALETIIVEKSEFSRKALNTTIKSIKMTPRAVTKRAKIAPRRSQDGFISVLFSLRFLHRFFVGLGSDVGAIWGGFWDPKSVIFGIDFSLIFACRSKIAPRAAKSLPRTS